MRANSSRLQEIENRLKGDEDAVENIILYWTPDEQPEDWTEEDGPYPSKPFRAENEDGDCYGEGATLAKAIAELLAMLRKPS